MFDTPLSTLLPCDTMTSALRKSEHHIKYLSLMQAVARWNKTRSNGKKLKRGLVAAHCRRGLIKGAVLRDTPVGTFWEIPSTTRAPERLHPGRPKGSKTKNHTAKTKVKVAKSRTAKTTTKKRTTRVKGAKTQTAKTATVPVKKVEAKQPIRRRPGQTPANTATTEAASVEKFRAAFAG